MGISICLAGDTMLGRGVADQLLGGHRKLFSDEVRSITNGADLFILNLECCISTRGEPWAAPGKPFFFRAPPAAVDILNDLGVDCVTLANNHPLDYGYDALADTFDHLIDAGITFVGAGPDLDAARAPARLTTQGISIDVLGVTDHPTDFAATPERAGVAYANLRKGVPDWILQATSSSDADVVVVTPHWGPNMTDRPLDYVEDAAEAFVTAGATLVAGHSAHVFHGVRPPVLFDLGDFVDDYAVDPILRNDLGLLWVVHLEGTRPVQLEAWPLKLEYCFTELAAGAEAEWIEQRLRSACAVWGTDVETEDGRYLVDLRSAD